MIFVVGVAFDPWLARCPPAVDCPLFKRLERDEKERKAKRSKQNKVCVLELLMHPN